MPTHKRLKRIFTTITLLSAISYFSMHAIFGPRGLTNLNQLNNNLENASQELQTLTRYKETIENKIQGLNENTLDLDLLDEQVRNILGYADRKEIIIYNDE